jgi:hypothetical protein
MLLGSRKTLGIEIRPLGPTWERRYLPERTTWGALSIWVDGTNLCRNLRVGSDSVEDSVNVPLAPLADWLVRSWPSLAFEERASTYPTMPPLHDTLSRWGMARSPVGISEDDWIDSRERWWSKHFLSAGADGALLPGLAFSRHDENLIVEWRQPSFAGDAPVFLSTEGSSRIPWVEAAETLTAFVREVSEWLRSEQLVDLYPWLSEAEPLRHATESLEEILTLYAARSKDDLFRLMGVTRFEPLLERLGLSPNVDDPAASPVTQVLRDLPPNLPEGFGDELRELDRETRSTADLSLDPLRGVALDAARSANSVEEAGQYAARVVRHQLGLDGGPIDDTESVLHSVGITVRTSSIEGVGRMMTGVRPGKRAVAVILQSVSTAVVWGRRFEMARALGHLLLDPVRTGAVGAASSRFAAGDRRRRSGAFAAEFLLPLAALEGVSGGRLDGAAQPTVFKDLMSHYGVGARAAAYQLWNHGLLSTAGIRDDLIDEFASRA